MTSICETRIKCAVCGKRSHHDNVASTSIFCKPDLDGRPGAMARGTMPFWIQRCPRCGYCAPELNAKILGRKRFMEKEIYQNQLNDPNYPELCNTFLCFALLEENAGNLSAAAWAIISGAWICDDAKRNKKRKHALELRSRAVIMIERALEKGEKYDKQAGYSESVLVDLLRRSGQFNKAEKACKKALKMDIDGVTRKILNFQKKLIRRQDIGCHCQGEV
ncbi:hypothetical protein KJ564_15675 [bacterium]|nr:hypothetical protein [bacterium]